MNHMHGNSAQHKKVTRVLKVEDLENRTLMASDLAASLQALVTASNRQQQPAIFSLRGSSSNDIAANRSGGTSNGFEFRNSGQGNASIDLSRLSNLAASLNGRMNVRGDASVQTNSSANQNLSGGALSAARLDFNNRFNQQPSTATTGASDADGVDNSPINSRFNSFSLISSRIATGQRPLADRLTAPRTFSSDANLGSNANVQATDAVFGSDFATALNSNLRTRGTLNLGSNLLSSNTRATAGWVINGSHTPEHATAAQRIFLAKASAADAVFGSEFTSNLNSSLSARSSLNAGARATGGWMLNGTHIPEHVTPAQRIFLAKAGLARSTNLDGSLGANINARSNMNLGQQQSALRFSSNWVLNGSHRPENPTPAQRIFLARA